MSFTYGVNKVAVDVLNKLMQAREMFLYVQKARQLRVIVSTYLTAYVLEYTMIYTKIQSHQRYK